jgi:hypothetical protein
LLPLAENATSDRVKFVQHELSFLSLGYFDADAPLYRWLGRIPGLFASLAGTTARAPER